MLLIILFHNILSNSHGPKPGEPLGTLPLLSLGWLIEEVLASQPSIEPLSPPCPRLPFLAPLPYLRCDSDTHSSRSRASATWEALPIGGKYSDATLRAAHGLSLREDERREVFNGLLDL